jgi:Na+/H+ antiporter NhaD/arsenite permease-like protein
MDLAWISLAALIVVIVVSCTTAINPGVLSVALAWLIVVVGAPLCGQTLALKDLLAGFPSDLFLTLVGVTLLFTQAHVNGTLERISRLAVRLCRGNAGLVPVVFFLLAAGLSSVGAGNIAAAALMAPLAMAAATRAKIPPFLMTIMVAHGSLAGALSPFAPTGIIANKLMSEKMGLTGFEMITFGYNLLAQAIVGVAGFLLLGGWRLYSRRLAAAIESAAELQAKSESAEPDEIRGDSTTMDGRHWITLLIIAALIAGVIFGGWHVGLAAFVGAALMALARLSDESKALREMPWGVIVMVCGVTVLTALLEKTGGIDRFAEIIGRVSTPRTVIPVVTLITGGVSVYSSTSGVVLPAFLPMVPKLVEQLGGGDALNIALAVIVGGHLVDSSPLSTIGALCVAAAPLGVDRRVLFNQVLAWGLSMTVVGAGLCYLLFG